MKSNIKTYTRENGEIQRVQWVQWEDFSDLNFFHPPYSEGSFDGLVTIYKNFLVPARPEIFGNLVLFRLPENMPPVPDPNPERYGAVAGERTKAAVLLQQGLRVRGGKPSFKNKETEELYRFLEEKGCLAVVSGKLPTLKVIPVSNFSGFLTSVSPKAQLKCNAGFFVMDCFDCGTVYDSLGTSVGLCVKNGEVLSPPLFLREALMVRKNGEVSVEIPDLRALSIEIDGKIYRHGQNARVYVRPERAKTPAGKETELAVIGRTVVAVRTRGGTDIPSAGFVLRLKDGASVQPGAKVTYRGMEDVAFAMQVGNSVVKNGVKTDKFISPFFNIFVPGAVPFPPCLYPLDFNGGRAARMALGTDKNGHPMLVWTEGASRVQYTLGQDSCGTSLLELGDICVDLGMWNGVNLDGGGSAQILLENKRSLRVTDRKPDKTELERAVPMGLILE